jgi:dolichyl-phosphate beta-glucosyltransferase
VHKETILEPIAVNETDQDFTPATNLRLLSPREDALPKVGDSPSRRSCELEIVIPAFNEARRISHTITELARYLSESGIDAALVVVDNGSTDQTAGIVDGLGALGIDVSVIGCARPGKGAAVRRGILSSNARFVGFCDADAATSPSALKDILSLLRNGNAIVIGSRRCPGSRYIGRPTTTRRFGGWLFRRAANLHVRGIADTQCGFKFFETEVARILFEATALDGFAFDVELLALAQARDFEIIEVPVQWSAQEGSTMRTAAGLRALRDIFRPMGLTSKCRSS